MTWRNIPIILVSAGVVAGVLIVYWVKQSTPANIAPATINNNRGVDTLANTNTPDLGVTTPTNTTTMPPPAVNTNGPTSALAPAVVIPIADFFNRITKKPFGIYITPKSSPIQPEKFTGYHTGTDAETTVAEKDVDMPIYAITGGTVVFAGHVNGYGGVIMIRHTIEGETVTALYGHLRISSFSFKKGETVKMNAPIAVLGSGYTSETDGERKHLHFGLIKSASINYKGYVQTKSALSAWEDPVAWLHAHGAA